MFNIIVTEISTVVLASGTETQMLKITLSNATTEKYQDNSSAYA